MEDNKCPLCSNDLFIAGSKFDAKNDNLPIIPTKIFSVLTMVCINPNCPNFAGSDLNNPKVVVNTIWNQVNT